MTFVKESRLREIALSHGYDNAEYDNLFDPEESEMVTISRNRRKESFSLVKTEAGWIAGFYTTYLGYAFPDREDHGHCQLVTNLEKFALDNKTNAAFAFFPNPEAALLDIFDYGIEP